MESGVTISTNYVFESLRVIFPAACCGDIYFDPEFGRCLQQQLGRQERHGPLALVDAKMPIVAVAPTGVLMEKLHANLEKVKSRNGVLFVFADSGSHFDGSEQTHTLAVTEPESCYTALILFTIPLQLLAYHVALIKGTDVDQPRNLTKSVTVE